MADQSGCRKCQARRRHSVLGSGKAKEASLRKVALQHPTESKEVGNRSLPEGRTEVMHTLPSTDKVEGPPASNMATSTLEGLDGRSTSLRMGHHRRAARRDCLDKLECPERAGLADRSRDCVEPSRTNGSPRRLVDRDRDEAEMDPSDPWLPRSIISPSSGRFSDSLSSDVLAGVGASLHGEVA